MIPVNAYIISRHARFPIPEAFKDHPGLYVASIFAGCVVFVFLLFVLLYNLEKWADKRRHRKALKHWRKE